MAGTGYCTVGDVRRALQETVADFDSGAWGASNHQVVVDAIAGQTEWVRETTHRHWYESGGISEDDENVIPSSAQTHDEDVLTVPASPHPAPSQQYRHTDVGNLSYPRPMAGRYVELDLRRRDVSTLTELLVLDSTGDTVDWTAEKTEGRGEDYYLQVDDSNGLSTLYLDTTALPTRQNWENAVIASYEYGIDGIPGTVRRGVAFRAGAELLMDDQANLGIPENSQLVAAESKKQAMENKADELLSIHMLEAPVA